MKRIFTVLVSVALLMMMLGGCTEKAPEKPFTDKILENNPKETKEKSKLEKFTGLALEKDDVRFKFEGKNLKLDLPIYYEKNRYYIPFTEIIERIGGSIEEQSNKLKISVSNVEFSIDKDTNTYNSPKGLRKLKKPMIIKDEVIYVTFIDFIDMLNLRTRWFQKSKTIVLYWNKENSSIQTVENRRANKAFLRLEDIAAGGIYENTENLEKLRILSDFLRSKGAIYHMAWVPRYVEPPRKIDLDLSKEYSFYASEFLFTLDYCINRNAIVGLHGYTHQQGNEASVVGWEFTDKLNANEKAVRDRVEASIKLAKDLDIPFKFFESPHYGARAGQKKIIEEYFDYIYEPHYGANETRPSLGDNKRTLYVPTPLDYVHGVDKTDRMLQKINSINSSTLASMFYHPGLEFEFIKLTSGENEYPSFEYLSNSPLHRILDAFEKKGYSLRSIEELRN